MCSTSRTDVLRTPNGAQSYDAIADGIPAEHAVRRVLETVALPQVAPRQRAGGPQVPSGFAGQSYPGQAYPGPGYPGQPDPGRAYPGVAAPGGPQSFGPSGQQRSA